MPGPKERIKGIAERIAASREELLPILLAARERVTARMRRYAGRDGYSTRAAVRDALYGEIRSLYADLEGDLRKWSQKAVERELGASLADAIDDMADAQIAASEALEVTRFSRKHLVEYMERVSPFSAGSKQRGFAVNAQLSRMAESDVFALRQAAVEVFREAAASGMTARERQVELQRRVLAYADDPKTWQFIDKSGRTWKSGNYFNMVNRTISANVSRDAYGDAIIDVGGDLVEVIGGSSTHDQVCKAAPVGYVGRLLSLTGATEGFETVAEARANGLFHPNCTHTYKVVFEETTKGKEKIDEQRGQEPVRLEKKPKPKPKTSVKAR